MRGAGRRRHGGLSLVPQRLELLGCRRVLQRLELLSCLPDVQFIELR